MRAHLLIVDDLKSLRRHIFVALSFITAVITPDPTPVSMLLMTIPFYILYELTIIILARIMRDKPDKIIAEGTSAAEELLARSNPKP
jgi:sec-independent protein translocase protein TatC